MSDSRAAFLRSICENPDDDTPRLVFADWLDEHDEPVRAEFIRLQIGLAVGTIPESRRAEAEARVAKLLEIHQQVWWGELPVCKGVTWTSQPSQFTRGFADAVGFGHGKAWREHSEAVFAAAPITRLKCGGTFSAKTGRPLLASPLLGRLADFRGPKIDARGAEAFASNPHLVGRLRTLELSSSAEHGDSVAAALGKAPGLRNLESLTFCHAGPLGVAALANSPHLTKVKNLHLHGGPVGDDGAEALAVSPYLSAVDHIMLNGCEIGDRGAVALAGSKHLTSLRELYLGGGNPITDAGALQIAATSGLPRLADLHLWGSQITGTGARALADFAERRGLQVLNLRHCPLPSDVTRELTERLGSRFLA